MSSTARREQRLPLCIRIELRQASMRKHERENRIQEEEKPVQLYWQRWVEELVKWHGSDFIEHFRLWGLECSLYSAE